MSAPLSTKALSLLAHIREGKIETAKAIVMSKLMVGHAIRRTLQERTGLTSGSVTARLNELEKEGLVKKFTKVQDVVTGKTVWSYARTPEVVYVEDAAWQS